MIVVNFAHPLTEAQYSEIERLAGAAITLLRDVACHVDNERPLASQVAACVDAVGLKATEWQSAGTWLTRPVTPP